ncbi:hypothetical protein NEIG_01944 [Nematocida sp. ERTm5]|nr:hypothetical protein NEIRO02_0947 [Nematocida sp. AWRm79]KAI5183266.1 hypothetical protein NEIRO03_0879 [Nematocida sp. AWRm78]OAG33446.1 hypothetical protein NEIG_01944 [Nematocida sp. ERTm5]
MKDKTKNMSAEERTREIKEELYIDRNRIGEAYKKILRSMPLEASPNRNKFLLELDAFPKKKSFKEKITSKLSKWFSRSK